MILRILILKKISSKKCFYMETIFTRKGLFPNLHKRKNSQFPCTVILKVYWKTQKSSAHFFLNTCQFLLKPCLVSLRRCILDSTEKGFNTFKKFRDKSEPKSRNKKSNKKIIKAKNPNS